jgi:uncharacterized sulfatase
MHSRSRDSTPFEMGHNGARYNFEAIYAAARLATSRENLALPKLVRMLDDQDSGVRYWAAVGLLVHQDAGVRAGRDELVAALADDSPMVQITAAEALGRFGDVADAEQAIEVLLRHVQPDGDYYLAVAAWNALDYLDERALPAVDAIKNVPTQWPKVPARMGDYAVRLKEKTLSDLEQLQAPNAARVRSTN